tara:strand:- start:81 stop:674 length:594 start_codon:yes stop_codon:yes gene_type:complete
MKKTLQLFILFIIIILGIFFYNTYLKEDQKVENTEIIKELREEEKGGVKDIQNNLIKNLKYDVKFENNSQYSISADLSELTYINEEEIVNMNGVKAIIIDENNFLIVITSNQAVFNNKTYSTVFNENVKINYLKNEISSEKLELDFDKNIVTITDNVVYEGIQGFVKTDNIKIYLLTKNVEIFMNDKKKKVQITSKN